MSKKMNNKTKKKLILLGILIILFIGTTVTAYFIPKKEKQEKAELTPQEKRIKEQKELAALNKNVTGKVVEIKNKIIAVKLSGGEVFGYNIKENTTFLKGRNSIVGSVSEIKKGMLVTMLVAYDYSILAIHY